MTAASASTVLRSTTETVVATWMQVCSGQVCPRCRQLEYVSGVSWLGRSWAECLACGHTWTGDVPTGSEEGGGSLAGGAPGRRSTSCFASGTDEIVTAVGVRQALLEDPSGNPVELFEPLAGYHERAPRAGQ